MYVIESTYKHAVTRVMLPRHACDCGLIGILFHLVAEKALVDK